VSPSSSDRHQASAAPHAPAAGEPRAGGAPLPRNVVLLGWASLLNDVASEMLFPLLPTFLITVLGGTKTHLGLIDGIADAASSILKLLAGAWSDAAGKRKAFVVGGYAVAAIARPLISLAAAPWHVLTLRAIDRVGKGIRTAPRDALIAESAAEGERGRAFGFHRAMDHLGAAIGPAIAFGFLWLWPGQLRLLFALALLPALPMLVLVLVGLRETAPKKPAGDRRLILSLAPFDHRFRLLLASLLIFSLGNSSDSFLLVRAEELGVSAVWLPVLWGVFHVAKSWLTNAAGAWVDRIGPRPLIWTGWLIYAATYLAFAMARGAAAAWGLFLLYAVHYALTEPAEKTLVASLAGPKRRGLAFAWFHLVVGLAALPANIVFGAVYERLGPLAAFGMGAGLALAAALLLLGVTAPAAEAR